MKTAKQKEQEKRAQIENELQAKELALYKFEKTVGMPIGNDQMITTVADRIFSLHPNADRIGMQAFRTVAQLALVLGANPFPLAGELYVDRPYDNGPLFIAIGVDYYRRNANEKGGVMWVQPARLMTDDELAEYGAPDGAIGAVAAGYKKTELKELLQLGLPFDVAEKRLVRPSHAIVTRDEMTVQKTTYVWKNGRKTNEIKSKAGDPAGAPRGRTWRWVAEKRAEKAVYKLLGITDTSFTQRIQAFQQFIAESDAQFETTITDEEANYYNDALFGDASTVLDGEFILNETNEPDAEPDAEPETPEMNAETAVVDEPDVEPDETKESVENANFTEAEQAIIETKTRAQYWAELIKHIDHYSSTKHAKEVAKSLGYNNIPKDAFDRMWMFRIMKFYGEKRDEGIKADEVFAMIDAEFTGDSLPF